MITRRGSFAVALGAGAALTFGQSLSRAAEQGLIQRAIPSTGEKLPVVGLGSSATFGETARSADTTPIKDVMKTLVERGGKVFDTAPSYGESEAVAGKIAKDLDITSKIFWATKVNVVPWGSKDRADPAAARAQIEASFKKLGVSKIDLIQVHNLGDVPTQLGILKELKREGRVRYIGVTTTFDPQYAELERIMRGEPLDFIGVDYALDAREVEATILPLAMERKIGVLVYVPLGRNRLFRRVEGKKLPDWAKDFDAASWAQFFIKYVVAHPAVTVVTPATSNAAHMADDIGGGRGRLPNEATRKKMVELIDALPPA